MRSLLLRSHELMGPNSQRRRGPRGNNMRLSLQATAKFKHEPLELAFYIHKRDISLFPSIIARNIATLIVDDLEPLVVGGPKYDRVIQYLPR